MAALLFGVFCFFLAGFVTGNAVRFEFRSKRRRSEIGRQQLWLQQAGARVSFRQFVTGSAAVGLVAFLIVLAVTGAPIVAAVPAVVIALIPRAYFARRRMQRLREVQAVWPDGLRDIVSSIAAGRSLGQAVSAMAASGPEPLQQAFARFPLLARMLGTVPALEVVKEELADPTSDRVIEVLILSHERGGQIVKEILEDLVAATTRDLKAADEIESEGLEMKINSRAVLVLPWFVLVMLTIRPGAFRSFYQSPAGLTVVVVGALMTLLGGWLIGRLGYDQGEQRVFGSGATATVAEGQ